MSASLRHEFCVAAALISAFVSGCGGGNTTPPPPQMSLTVRLISTGTLVDCETPTPTPARLTMSSGSASPVKREISCPSQILLSGEFSLAQWDVVSLPANGDADAAQGSARALTTLPPPHILLDGENLLTIRNPAIDAAVGNAVLVQTDPPKVALMSPLEGARAIAQTPFTEDHWRWSITFNEITYTSPAVPARKLSLADSGVWGAMVLGEVNEATGSRLIQAENFPGTSFGQFTEGRVFRDVRYVDLNNDGLLDIISNVFGEGCTLIAFANPDGNYTVKTPLRADGSCIGGHGETILVADFDGDGLVDIFLPSYERFDYLKNLGHGEFVEMADEMGISFPNYLPKVEGAAAVDIDQDGDVDIVVASEILINDGNGRFTPQLNPFGPDRIFDEGLSVADIDRDGWFDIAKNDPSLGPRIFWGAPGKAFSDAGWLFRGAVVSSSSYGMAFGDLTGNSLPDLVLAGGRAVDTLAEVEAGATGEGPRLCAQTKPRTFKCLSRFVPAIAGAWSDLVMVTDTDGDGMDELVARYGTLITYTPRQTIDMNVFRIDFRDSANRRNMYGQALKATCDLDGSLVALKSVDGGNGYMAQGEYVVSFTSRWCKRIRVETGGPMGPVHLGSFAPGTHLVKLAEVRSKP